MMQNELNIIVCIKTAPSDTVREHFGSSEERFEPNFFDHTALEYGFRLRGEFGGRVDVLSIGPMSTMKLMRETLAMGADRAVLLSDPALVNTDALNMTKALSAAIRLMVPYDLVLFGSHQGDRPNDQIGPKTASLLNLPFLIGVDSILSGASELRGQRNVNHQLETFEMSFPAALAIHTKQVNSRNRGIFGITAAFEDLEVDVYSLADIGLKAHSVNTYH
jgi:electron transfer flavoprotein beta subunit